MDAKYKHLEFIQGVVNRLAANSFQLKGWGVVLVAAIFFLLGRGGPLKLVAIAWIPVLFFWGLDGYFLRQERLFRALYDHVRVQEEGESTARWISAHSGQAAPELGWVLRFRVHYPASMARWSLRSASR